MNKKYFVINNKINSLPEKAVKEIEVKKNKRTGEIHKAQLKNSSNYTTNTVCKLKHVPDKVLIKVDVEQKNFFTFSNGQTIRVERKYDNLDRSYTQQTLGVVVSAENIPTDALVLFHFNNAHDSNLVTDYTQLSGDEIAAGIKIYSVSESSCFLWKMVGEEEWQPTYGFAIAERVYKPYEGRLAGITPKLLKNTLFIKTGELKGKIVRTLNACDYNILFRNEKGVDEHIIRCRHFENEDHIREEIIAIDEELTEQLYAGKLWVGTHPNNAKKLEGEYAEYLHVQVDLKNLEKNLKYINGT